MVEEDIVVLLDKVLEALEEEVLVIVWWLMDDIILFFCCNVEDVIWVVLLVCKEAADWDEAEAYLATMLFLLLLIFCSFSCSGLFGFLFVNDAVVEVVVMANDSREACLL